MRSDWETSACPSPQQAFPTDLPAWGAKPTEVTPPHHGCTTGECGSSYPYILLFTWFSRAGTTLLPDIEVPPVLIILQSRSSDKPQEFHMDAKGHEGENGTLWNSVSQMSQKRSEVPPTPSEYTPLNNQKDARKQWKLPRHPREQGCTSSPSTEAASIPKYGMKPVWN